MYLYLVLYLLCHNENLDFIENFSYVTLIIIDEDSYRSQLQSFQFSILYTKPNPLITNWWQRVATKPSGLPSGGIFRWRGTYPAQKLLAHSEGERLVTPSG